MGSVSEVSRKCLWEVSRKRLAAVRAVVASDDVGADVHTRMHDGRKPLDAAAYFNHLDVVRVLCRAGATSERAMMYAREQGNDAIVAYLSSRR